MSKQQSKREILSPGSQRKTPSNVLPFLPKTGIEHVDSTTIVEQAWNAEQRAKFMEAYAEAIERAEGERHEKLVDRINTIYLSGLCELD